MGMRRRRAQLKRTHEQAAEGIEVSLASYQRWERGAQRPHLRTQARIAKYFRVPLRTVDEWFDDEDDCPTCGPTDGRAE